MSDVPFCERNTRSWVILLVVFGAGVLGYSFWIAWERGELSGFSNRRGGSAGTHAAAPPATAPLAAGLVIDSARTRWMQPVATSDWSAAGGAPGNGTAGAGDPAIDVVTRATPMGGIQVIGATKARDIQQAFNSAADIIRPAVVCISASRSGTGRAPALPPDTPRFLDPFDGVPDVVIGQLGLENVGSGLIVDSRGFVVTNGHVVNGAKSIVVTRFHRDGEHLNARVVAQDPASDLALLQLLAEATFPVATFADSSRVEVGDFVLAVGNPFGLGHSVTSGIVSGRRGTMTIAGARFQNLIQTDAPINRGSSGGPLVDLNGQVIGINTAIYAPTGVFNGTGFAIPSNRVGAFIARALEDTPRREGPPLPGIAEWGNTFVGLGVLDMSTELARRLTYPHVGGVFVASVALDSPADAAEIARGDIISAINGSPIPDTDVLRRALRSLRPGQTAALTIWRDGRTDQLNLLIPAGAPAGAR